MPCHSQTEIEVLLSDGNGQHRSQELTRRLGLRVLLVACVGVVAAVTLAFLVPHGYFTLSQAARVQSSPDTLQLSSQPGCCTSSSDSSDPCGTCYPGSYVSNDQFCGQSKTNCLSCGGTATWCGHGGSVVKPGHEQKEKKVHVPKKVKLPKTSGTALKNPFKDKTYYVNPHTAAKYDKSMEGTEGKIKNNLKRMKEIGAAYWIDKKSKLHGDGPKTLEGILKDAASQDPVPLVTVIWYDLPNRDCAAKASTGEICCTKGKDGHCDLITESNCTEGLEEYKTEYVDPFIKILKKFVKAVPVVVILEPDSLPNLATNLKDKHCGNPATVRAYKEGSKYALDQIVTETPEVTVYLDAAHGAWLGWGHQCNKYLDVMEEMKFPMNKVRGFATNVAKYQPLGVQCPWEHNKGYMRNAFCLKSTGGNRTKHMAHPCCDDPCGLIKHWDSGNNEINYAALLISAANYKFGTDHFRAIIDTGRNAAQYRSDCNNFCNIRKAGAGIASTAHTANSSLLDAYFWLKTPGESDGCTKVLPDGDKCPRYDAVCGSEDSLGNDEDEPKAPEAGQWFDYQVKQLAEFADLDGKVDFAEKADE